MVSALFVVLCSGQVDVASLGELASAQSMTKAPSSGDELPPSFLAAAAVNVEALVGVALEPEVRELLVERVREGLEAQAKAIPQEPGPARYESWMRLARLSTTPQFAQEVLDAWLELPPLEPVPAPTTGQWAQATQLDGTDAFRLAQAVVVDEHGTRGQVNGLVDPGEWVQLEIGFTNATRLPWFSTSATPRGNACLWVDGRQRILVGEMAPLGKGSLRVWVWIAERCSEQPVLRLSLADTHRGALSGSLTVALWPTSSARPRPTRVNLDADALGFSDGSKAAEIGPKMRFELSADLTMPGEHVARIEQSWVVSAPSRHLFSSLAARPSPCVSQGNGVFLAGDDLDGQTVDEDAWIKAATARGPLAQWLAAPAPGRLWLALDTRVVLQAPVPARAAPASKKGDKVAPFVPTAPAGGAVADLVRQFVSLEPHAVVPERSTAVEAASGYELVFERTAFLKAYEALLARAPTMFAEPEAPSLTAAFRSYIAVPTVVVSHQPPREVGQLKSLPLPEPPPPPAPPRRQWLQADLSVGLSVLTVGTPRNVPTFWAGSSAAVLPTMGGRVFVGPHVVGVVGARHAPRVSSAGSFFETALEPGLGFRFDLGRFALTPYAALNFRWRTSSVANEDFVVGGIGALNARVLVAGPVAFSIDLAVPFGMGGPLVFSAADQVVWLAGGISFRAMFGVSLVL